MIPAPQTAHIPTRWKEADQGVVMGPTRLKRSQAFYAIYRRGRWAHGTSLSLGVLANKEAGLRVGLRTRRGLKGAVARNRLKRQLRTILGRQHSLPQHGFDIVVVIHPAALPAQTAHLSQEFTSLCKRLGVIR